MEFVCLGKIVNTHGIKGEVRILSQIRYKDRIFVKGMPIYIGRKKVPEVIDGYRVHKNFDMITMDGYHNINEVLKYKGQLVYIKRDDLKLEEGEFLDTDLIGMRVFMDDKEMGVVKKVLIERQDKLVVDTGKRDVYVPYVKGVIQRIIPGEGIILENIHGLFD